MARCTANKGVAPGPFPGHGVSQDVAKSRDRGRDAEKSGRCGPLARRPRRSRSGPQSLAEIATVAVARAVAGGGSSRQEHAPSKTGTAIAAALQERLGGERFAVWFGDCLRVNVRSPQVSGERWAIRLFHAPVFTSDWLQKTFSHDVRDVAESVCGGAVEIDWQPLPAGTVQPDAADSETEHQPQRGGQDGSGPDKAARRSRNTGVSRSGRRQPGQQKPVRPMKPAARLDDFVVGASNRMAYAAAELATSRLGEISPVLLYGPTSVGKSHLLAAICSHAREQRPELTTLVLSAEQFTTNFLQALRGTGLPGFRRSCRSVDLLAIDDLHFFIGKRATLLELQSTVDSLHRAGKQIIFASDRDVEGLAGLGSELTGRLRGGITAAILPPDHDVRRGIVAGLAARRRLDLPDEVISYLADHLTRHARELIGGVNRLEAASHMLGVPVTLELARESLADLVRSSSRSLRLADVEKAVCKAFGLGANDLQNSRRSRAVNHPRMLAMFLARKHTGAALTEIGRYFGRRSHSTVIAAEKAVRKWMTTQADVVLADATWDVEQAIRHVEDVLRAG
jgi:chromosomal replication initiator protein